MWKKKLGSANQKMNTRRLITALKAKKPGNRPKPFLLVSFDFGF